MRRVAVTGLGVVTPLGIGIDAFRHGLFEGLSGAGLITLFDASRLPTRIAAEVPWSGPILRDRKVSFAEVAAREAMAGGRPTGEGGLSLGIGLELFSMDDLAELCWGAPCVPRIPRPVAGSAAERLTFLQTPSDLCAHVLGAEHALTRPPIVHVSACAAGTDAVGAGFRLVATGRRDWVLAGGADSMINPLGVAGFSIIGATTRSNDRPAQASRPFDRRRDGFLLGEGAGFLLLEAREAAERRGARIHGEIAGYGSSLDAHGISEPHPEGRGACAAMQAALDEAGVGPEAVDAVNAHGTSTPRNDPVETLALKRLLGARAKEVPVIATKSMIGHLVAAAGAVEAVAALLCMEAGVLHPTLNLDEPDPACDLDYVPHRARRHVQRHVLSNSFGFGGQNASILLRSAHV